MITIYLLFLLTFFASTASDQIDYSLTTISDVVPTLPVVIIGGGNAGLSAGLYTARERIKTVVILGEQPGGLLVESSLVDNIPGIAPQDGKIIMDNFQKRAINAGAHLLYCGVEKINLHEWPFVLTLDNGDVIQALSVIIATGAEPKYLNIPGESLYRGRGVSTCALCDGSFFSEKDVIVVGGGNSAVEQAIHLVPHVRSATIVHRSSSMRATSSISDRLNRYPSISVKLSTKLVEIKGDDNEITHVLTENTQTGEQNVLETQGIFLAIGHDPRTQLFTDYLPRDEYGALKTINNGPLTNITGVFAAGDVVDIVYRQAITAQGMGAQAAIQAARFLQQLGLTKEIQNKFKPYEPEVFEQDDNILL